MIPSVKSLLECLPAFRDEWIEVKGSQSVYDIIAEILKAHKEFAPYYDEIALYFDGDTTEQVCRNIYDFLRRSVRYVEEKESDQTTAIPQGILTRGHGDCKHYSSFAGGVLDALNRITGANRKWNYRFASYSLLDRTPHHVFVVCRDDDRDGEEIWIDPTPGASLQVPVWQIDKTVNAMPLRRNIGAILLQDTETALSTAPSDVVYTSDILPVDETQELAPAVVEQLDETSSETEPTPELQQAIEILMHYNVMNDEGAISDAQLEKLAATLPQDEFELVSNARQTVQLAIADAINSASDEASAEAAIGSIFSKIWRGVKKVTLAAPRNAYLSLVAINAFGMATKLYNAIYQQDGSYWQPGQDKLYKKWNSFGGDWHALNNAIKSGHKKRALLGFVETDEQSIGVAPAIPAWVAIASALIAAITPLVKEILNTRAQQGQLPVTIDPATGLPYNMNTPGYYSGSFDIMQWVKDNPIPAAGIGVGLYFLLTDKSKKTVNAVRKKMSKKTVGLVIIGAGALYYFYKKQQDSASLSPSTDTGGDTTTDTIPTDTTTPPPVMTTTTTPTSEPQIVATGFMFTKDLMPYYSTVFDPEAYLARYPDVRADKYYSQNPLEHYQQHGQYEGRFPSADPENVRYDSAFDPVYYGDRYPDIKTHFGTNYAAYYQHWLQYGQYEGRHPGGAYLLITK